MPIVYASITELPPKYKIIGDKPLIEEVIDFVLEYDDINEDVIKKLAKKFNFSIDISEKVANAVINGNFLKWELMNKEKIIKRYSF